jgi:hypothetical protein
MSTKSKCRVSLWRYITESDLQEFRTVAGFKAVPQVPAAHLITANKKAVQDREAFGSANITVSIVSALAKKIPSEEVLATMHRLHALANTLAGGDGKAWRIDFEGQDYTLLDEALFRAAARAPLKEAATMREMKFDLKIFLAIALEESKPEGRS